ncbi:UNVERIFIED_CONTAM: hypothetical protein K2H54_041679 [Gekko kuhli]
MQRSLCRVKGQTQWSMLSSNCGAPTHPHNFEEIKKQGNYQKVQIRRRQISAPSAWSRTFNFELLLFNVISLHFIYLFIFSVFYRNPIKNKSLGSMQLVNVITKDLDRNM